ncbi:MAG: response regulator [Acidobacteriota bacterium]
MAKAKILIVDDDPGILVMLRLMLRLEGYEPLTCEDAGEVVNMVSQDKPDLVLLDAMMPQFDGLTVLSMLKAEDLPHRPPVILFTGNVDEGYINRALEAGARGVLIKPFVKEDLLDKIRGFLKTAGGK